MLAALFVTVPLWPRYILSSVHVTVYLLCCNSI